MPLSEATVVGIDVGGEKKGFHAVALRGDFFVKISDQDPVVIFDWCIEQKATVVAVDAPCKWSRDCSSRTAERDLRLFGEKIHIFATPTHDRAEANTNGFYAWVFNGEKLYRKLKKSYSLFSGVHSEGLMCIETFPHAVACALSGSVISAKYKARVRRKVLQDRGYDVSGLPNIDFVDAAICAVAADEFRRNSFLSFGNAEEGFIIVPAK